MSEDFARFRDKLEKEQKTILDNILKKTTDDCKKSIKDEITRDQLHSMLVNMCAYAFSESGPLIETGYHFVTVEPLYRFRGEKGNKIFDLVLYNREQKIAILIECKSSISDSAEVLRALNDQITNTQFHRKDLEEEIGGEIDSIEYVICSIPQDVEEVAKVMRDEPVCLWSVDLFAFTLKLYNPSASKDSGETSRLIKQRQLHRDPKLREPLYSKTESQGQIDGYHVTPSSHIGRILSRVIIRVIQKILPSTSAQERKFWMYELVDMLREELPRTDVADIRRIADEIIKLGTSIEIFEVESSEKPMETVLSLKISARSSRRVENEISDRYIEKICDKESPKRALKEYREYVAKNVGTLDYLFSKTNKESETSRANNVKRNKE